MAKNLFAYGLNIPFVSATKFLFCLVYYYYLMLLQLAKHMADSD